MVNSISNSRINNIPDEFFEHYDIERVDLEISSKEVPAYQQAKL